MNLANKITTLRIILIPFFIGAIDYGRLDIALGVFLVAIVTDAADGFVARLQHQKTALGAMLDPIADKLLLVSAFICLAMVKTIPVDHRLPPYVPLVVISRDVILVVGAAVVHLMTGELKIVPSITGKITTFFQMMTIVSVLMQSQYSPIIWNATVALTIISGIGYLVRGSRLLNENHAHHHQRTGRTLP